MELCLFFDCSEMQNCASNMLDHLQVYSAAGRWGETSWMRDAKLNPLPFHYRFNSSHVTWNDMHPQSPPQHTSSHPMRRMSLFHDSCYLSLTHSHYILLIGLNVTSFEWNHFILFHNVPQIKLDLLYEWIVVRKLISVHISFTRWDT